MADGQSQGPYVLPISREVVAFSSPNCSLLGQRVSQVRAGWLPGEGCVFYILSALGRLGRSGLRWLNTLSVPHWGWLGGWWTGSTLPVQGMADVCLLAQSSCPGAALQPPWVAQPALAHTPWEQERKAEQCLSFPSCHPSTARPLQGSGGLLAWPSCLCLRCAWQSRAPAADVHLFLASQQPPLPTVVFSQGMRGSWLKLASLLAWPCQGR